MNQRQQEKLNGLKAKLRSLNTEIELLERELDSLPPVDEFFDDRKRDDLLEDLEEARRDRKDLRETIQEHLFDCSSFNI